MAPPLDLPTKMRLAQEANANALTEKLKALGKNAKPRVMRRALWPHKWQPVTLVLTNGQRTYGRLERRFGEWYVNHYRFTQYSQVTTENGHPVVYL